ncbi:DNA polymerase III subunit epsilon [Cellvibrio zantedeschiae]|uniref:DNA-directed DNA polymerase n=1 Tax=Cellvibrio zantedeschiae TaxID=1237077 RepID=A0ABQ3ARY6_9GAMM|nr:3'-5' exonuclease [Cellvibrio zantedeschiae]GGY62087.1 DNA polymerase III subunit epsilon [Cellvibrio zantedeschiae]
MTIHLAARPADTLIVFDFETTGLSPDMGDRSIEIGAVLIENGQITRRFQQLMNPGVRIPLFIENLTGITNRMASEARKNAEVMQEFFEFIDGHNLVAHNASFDERFLRAEFKRIKRSFNGGIACSLLASRRLFQQAPNHQLVTLVEYKNLPSEGIYHRALADAEITAHLWLSLLEELQTRHELAAPSFAFMAQLCKTPKHQLPKLLSAAAQV